MSKFRVLIIDDNEMAREGIRMILESDPVFEVVAEGSSGEEAITLSEYWMPDLVLMDIQMPGMGGLEATKKLKEAFPISRSLWLPYPTILRIYSMRLRRAPRAIC